MGILAVMLVCILAYRGVTAALEGFGSADAGVAVRSLRDGDCFRGAPAMTSSTVQRVSCRLPHDGRVVGRARLLDDDVTVGRPLADGAGRRACAAALQDAWPRDDTSWWAAVPSWDDFVGGARVVVCGSPD